VIIGHRLIVALVAASLAASAPVVSQTNPGIEPVPAEQLKGRAFIGSDSSFSVEAPTDDWQWLRFTQGERTLSELHPAVSSRMYALYDAKSQRTFVFSVFSGLGGDAPNESFMRGLQNGIERTSLRITGRSIQSFGFEPSDIPIKGASYRYHARAVSSDGAVMYRFGYIGGGTQKYQFEYPDLVDKEAKDFTAVVSSLREVSAAK
jgi:hypothetical protein